MKWPTKKDRRSDIQKELDRLYAALQLMNVDTKEYYEVLARYRELKKIEIDEKSRRPSADTWIQAGTTLLGIAAVLHHEKLHVISSKAFGWIPKMIRRG